ncbi:MAG: glycosyltransferase family 39 protein [Actinomycetota bacterium]|jgi:hypothetical protein
METLGGRKTHTSATATSEVAVADTNAADSDRRFIRYVVAATVVGGIWRLIRLISKWNVPLHYGDAWYYSIQAINNAHGRWFKEASGPVQNWGVLPGAEHPPLTSIVLAPASLLSNPQFWQRATMTLLGLAVIPLLAYLGRRLGGRRVGVVAAVIAAVYPNLWLSDALVMSESLLLLFVVLVLVAALRYHERFDMRSAVLLGVVIAVAGHARSEVLMYAPLFALIGLRSRSAKLVLQQGLAVLAVVAVGVLPWVMYNSGRFDAVVAMSTNEGTTWLGANCPLTYGGPGLGGWNLDCLAFGNPPPHEDSAQRSTRRRREAIAFARAHSSRLPVVVAARLLRASDLYGLDESIRADVGEERPRWGIWAGILSWWILAPMAALGLWQVRRGVRYIVMVPVVGAVVVAVVFYGAHRLRAPIEPVVVLGAAMWIVAVPMAWLDRRRPRSGLGARRAT